VVRGTMCLGRGAGIEVGEAWLWVEVQDEG